MKVIISGIASYKNPITFNSDKKVNLIYGLNGTGKSTFSNYLYDPSDPEYSSCSIEGVSDSDLVLVYNQKFINDNFYQSDELSGIFTLSKDNKEAERRVKEINDNIKTKNDEKLDLEVKKTELQNEISNIEETARETIWKIKTDHTGGDRVLDYCFDGLKRKEYLLQYLHSTNKPKLEPAVSVASIRKELESLDGDSAKKFQLLPIISFQGIKIEEDEIFERIILGSENSSVATLIEKLENSDWVKQGLQFIDIEKESDNQTCPFCQSPTITDAFIGAIKDYFDKAYEQDLNQIKNLKSHYKSERANIPEWHVFESHSFADDEAAKLHPEYSTIISSIERNLAKIDTKTKTPSLPQKLDETSSIISELNAKIKILNDSIETHNKKIDKLDETKKVISENFWKIMRWDYDAILEKYLADVDEVNTKIKAIELQIDKKDTEIRDEQNKVAMEQKKTVNIDEAIIAINSGLVDLGIDGFKIQKSSEKENFYKLIRVGQHSDDTFNTLSEGEKMIISFLYFIELCQGRKDSSSVISNKILIIDDPISSLSHIYVFNVGQLIKNYFTNPESPFHQVYILTHSLYFFYELTFMKKEDRDVYQNLYRITKDDNGTALSSMRYTEIQNDYQVYWQVVKNPDYNPALIANCMRNIIEYFFSFIEKLELSNVFNNPKLKDPKYQAFYRYVNRESHSFGQNILDFKEFNYEIFVEAFKLVFELNGYSKHCKKMMK